MSKHLSTSSPLALQVASQVGTSKKFFPDHSFFVRPLTGKDKSGVDFLLKDDEYISDRGTPRYGVFDQDHTLVALYTNYSAVVLHSTSHDISLFWAH